MREPDGGNAGLRVLRIAHSSVVAAWRERERALIRRGVDVRLATAEVWNEGGRPVHLEARADTFVTGVATLGRHPSVFVFDPRPLWRLLGRCWDVLDIHEEPGSLATAEILLLRWLRRRRGPFLLYSAQNIDKRYPPPFRWLERWALRHAAAVSVCNVAAGRICHRKGLLGRAVNIPLGVDVNHFAPAARVAPCGGLRIGYVGRLEDHKGVDVLLDSIVAHPTWTLEVVGAGPAEKALRRHATALGLDDRVRFAGWAGQDGLADLYRSLDVVAVPSIDTPGWSEQFCRVAVEAMASGVPVVASRCGALPEVIGPAGLLVPSGDPVALGAALASMAGDAERWGECRRDGLARAAGFSWEAIADSYLALYRQVGVAMTPVDPDPTLDVVIVAYGEPDLLGACLTSLAGAFTPIVVDNSSLPATRDMVDRSGGRYLDPGRNLGFAAGVNHGLAHRRAGSDVLLLNPDATITPEAILRLRQRLAEDPLLAAVAAAQVDPLDGHPGRVCWPRPTPLGVWLEAIGLGSLRDQCGFVIGSVLLLRAAALEDVGLLDERFFLYAEETDWEIRAQDRGWRVALAADAVASHVGAGTGGDPMRRETHFHASHERLIRKHHGATGWMVFRAGTMFGALIRIVVRRDGRRADATRRFALYRRGPCRAEALLGGAP